MIIARNRPFRLALACTSALCALGGTVRAQTETASATAGARPASANEAASASEVIVTVARTTRSAVALPAPEIQKILPGVNPLKAIQTLPGVLFQTADPWGNNEQNEEVFVHGFTTQQLGYTMDGVPLGDQQYGNYNGLSPSRALTSENTDRVVLSSGAGALGVASTSNLGGAIETFSRDPSRERGAFASETVGSYDTIRSFIRLESGQSDYGGAYLSWLHQDQRAWDFDGHQQGDQVNLKYVWENPRGKLTLFADYDSKVEPNEDATGFGNQQTAASTYFPYTRAFIYPELSRAIAYLQTDPTKPGTPPAIYGNNFSNYFSAAQREDLLGYAKYDWKVTPAITWSNQVYYHYDYGRGIVAGPVNQAGLPSLFAAYFPQLVVGSPTSTASLTNLVNLFGGTGYEVRTTEYHINRGGVISTLNWNIGQHQIEAGLWYEHNSEGQHRVWYPFAASSQDLSPYDTPTAHVFTQDAVDFNVDDIQLHLQDQWRILPRLLVQAGFKSSLQDAGNTVLINQVNLPTANPPVVFPTGEIDTHEWFLPQAGLLWDFTDHEQLFFNAQKNLRQFIPYSQGGNFFGTAPWSLGTQGAFDLFKSTVRPESSWTYEGGLRTQRPLSFGWLNGIQAQIDFYRVNFSNRILNVAPYNFINPAPSILVNVGGVTSDGVDLAATLRFGSHISLYDAVSYDKTTYDQDYQSGKDAMGNPIVVPTGGKHLPGQPEWMNKTILSGTFGRFEAQLSGDYVGDRYATYLNDLSVKGTFIMGLEASYRFADLGLLKGPRLAVNVTNLNDERGVSTLAITSAKGGYQAYPVAPRMVFVTLQAGL